jgi:N-acetylmuramic acid 6-phosphate etherase
MRSVTAGPKCLLPIAGRTIIDEVLMSLPPWIDHAIVVVSVEDEAISSHLAVHYDDPNLRIHVLRQEEPRGTMSGLITAQPLLKQLLGGEAGDQTFLCLNSDDVLDSGDLLLLSLAQAPAVLCYRGEVPGHSSSRLVEQRLPALHPAFNTGAYKLPLIIFQHPPRNSPRTGEQSLPATLEDFDTLHPVLAAAWFPNNTPDDYQRTQAAFQGQLRVTEGPAEVTADIDLLSTDEAVDRYRRCEAGLFEGSGLGGEEVASTLEACTARIAQSLGQKGGVILLGAGTSGRLDRIMRNLVHDAAPHLREYVRSGLSGGLPGFVRTPAGEEDDPNRGVADFERLAAGLVSPVVIGITCGMSAAYIGGALRSALRAGSGYPILLGFNPPHRAKDLRVGYGNWSMRHLALQLKTSPDAAVLCPDVGSEAIAGSVRLKGGTATLILLMQLLGRAAVPGFGHASFLTQVREAIDGCYSDRQGLCKLIEAIAARLIGRDAGRENGGRCYYVGSGLCGLMGFMDGNGCVTTFGSRLDDLRGVLLDGWESFLGSTDRELYTPGEDVFRLDYRFWETCVLPSLTPRDLVIHVIAEAGTRAELLSALTMQKVPQAALVVGHEDHSVASLEAEPVIRIPIPATILSSISRFLAVLAVKTVTNCVSTLAHVRRGRTYGNRMIDLALVNNKVFERAIREIAGIHCIPHGLAREALLRSVYLQEEVSESLRDRPIEEHVRHAAARRSAVPLAILLADPSRHLTVTEGRAELARTPIVRKLCGGKEDADA